MTHATATRVWGAAMFAAGALVLLAPPAPATEPQATAWWWRGSRAGVVAPAPNVPDGGLWVATEVRDAVAVSAVRAPAGMTRLQLAVADVTGTPAVRACPVEKGWKPVAAGTWEDRPDAFCDDGQVDGALSADGATMTFAVAALGVRELILIPAEGAAPFSVTFDKPGTNAIETAAPPITSATTPTTASAGTNANTRTATTLYAAPPIGNTAVTFDATVDELAPTTAPAPRLVPSPDPPTPAPAGHRTPLALTIAFAFLGVWGWRTRAASLAAGDHPLATPIRAGGTGAIEAAEGLLRKAEA